MGDIGEIGANLWWMALEEEERREVGDYLGGEKVDDRAHSAKP